MVALAAVVFPLVFFVLAARYLVRANLNKVEVARRVLDERYASREIDRGEYEQKCRDLLGGRALP